MKTILLVVLALVILACGSPSESPPPPAACTHQNECIAIRHAAERLCAPYGVTVSACNTESYTLVSVVAPGDPSNPEACKALLDPILDDAPCAEDPCGVSDPSLVDLCHEAGHADMQGGWPLACNDARFSTEAGCIRDASIGVACCPGGTH